MRVIWEFLRASLWFVPSLMLIAAVVVAQGLIELDHRRDLDALQREWPRLFGAGAEGARGMLATIASSMISVAGVAFSITVVALALASSQYTSRILRNFMRDRANQTVLGAFVGIFVYCLMVLRTIRVTDSSEFVPPTAVLFAVILAFVGIGCLIFFLHHIASSIQAESIIRAATDETLDVIDHVFPTELGEPADDDGPAPPLPPAATVWQPIPARHTGFIQSIDDDGLLHFACTRDTVVRMLRGIGEFVVEGSPLVSIAVGERPDDETIDELCEFYVIGRGRTMVRDAGFGIRQIVDVALKALSPGINDTTTAVTCVNHLTAILARLAARRVENPYRLDHGELRVIARGPTFPGLLAEAFDQIRQNAAGNVAILASLLDAIEILAARTRDAPRRLALRGHVDGIAELAARTIPAPRDRVGIETATARLVQML